jgi:hypothetical protein
VIGSIVATRYSHRLAPLVAHLAPAPVLHAITGSLGGALAVAARLSPPYAAILAHAARTAFISGMQLSATVSAAVALAGALLTLALLPARADR